MSPDDARQYIRSLYENLLKREPAPAEFAHWAQTAENGLSAENVFFAFVNSEEYRLKSRVSSLYPSGHYYSPVVDPATVVDYVAKEHKTDLLSISGIDVPINEMEEFWHRSSETIADTPFQELKS